MSERSRFFNRRSTDPAGEYTYSADDFAEFLNTFFSDGVVSSSSLKVSGSNNKITVTTGYAVISGHWYNNDRNLQLTNPIQSTIKRKDSIVLKFDREERNIKTVWITGSQDTYPVLTDSSDIKYLLLANVDLLAGGTIKSVIDKRTFSQALYTMSMEQFETQFTNFISACTSTLNQKIKDTTVNSELVSARGGLSTLQNRLNVTDNKHIDITEAGTENLFDYRQAQSGWLNHQGSIEPSDVACYTTDYIPIEKGIQMFSYDKNGNPVKYEALEFYYTRSSTGLMKYENVGASSWFNNCNANYVRLDFKVSDVKSTDLIITTSDIPPTKYIPYKQIIKPSAITSTMYGMDYIKNIISFSPNDIYAVPLADIAPSSTVKISITAFGGNNSTVVRADGKDLIDLYTNKVVDSSMKNILISVDNITSGIKMTHGGSIEVSYYNANCEDLLQMINNSSSYKVLQTNYNTLETSTEYEIVEKTEVEI